MFEICEIITKKEKHKNAPDGIIEVCSVCGIPVDIGFAFLMPENCFCGYCENTYPTKKQIITARYLVSKRFENNQITHLMRLYTPHSCPICGKTFWYHEFYCGIRDQSLEVIQKAAYSAIKADNKKWKCEYCGNEYGKEANKCRACGAIKSTS